MILFLLANYLYMVVCLVFFTPKTYTTTLWLLTWDTDKFLLKVKRGLKPLILFPNLYKSLQLLFLFISHFTAVISTCWYLAFMFMWRRKPGINQSIVWLMMTDWKNKLVKEGFIIGVFQESIWLHIKLIQSCVFWVFRPQAKFI